MPASRRRVPRGRPRPQPNSVHKRPKPAQKGPILPSVYTITVTRGYPRHNSVHKRPKLAQRAPILPFVYTIAATGLPATQQCTQTPQSGARRLLPPICVHYRGHAGPPATQQCTQTPQSDVERPLPPICVHSCGPEAPRGCPRSSRRNDSMTGVARAASPGPLPRSDRHRHITAPEQLSQLLGVLVRDPPEARVRPAVAAVEDDELIAGVQHDVAGLRRRLRRRPWAPVHLVVEQGPYIDVTAGRG